MNRKQIDLGLTALWTFFFLVVIDVGVNLAFRYPSDPKQKPNSLQQYFEYGRSTEGKLLRMTGLTDETSAPIVSAGWLEPRRFPEEPETRKSGDRLLVATYGMSFSGLLAGAIARTHPDVTVRSISAPSATANWTYGAYLLDRGRHQADAAVFTVMSSNIAMNTTLSGMTAVFDTPYPYTQPQYAIEKGKLKEIRPLVGALAEYRKALLENPTEWVLFRQQLAKLDPYYTPVLFRASLLDQSALIRLLRRSYAATKRQQLTQQVYGPDGFDPDSKQITILREMIRNFAETARGDGVIPIVYIVNNIGSKDHLYQALKPLLDQNSIPYVSSHTFASPDDPRLFLDNGHFLQSIDEEIAAEVIRVIDEE